MFAAVIGLILIAIQGSDREALLSPGPLSFEHSAIGGCSKCHQAAASGPTGWVRLAFGVDVPKDGDHACRTCHDLGADAGNPHSRPSDAMAALTRGARSRLPASDGSAPADLKLAAWLFANPDQASSGTRCATCHHEHQGSHVHLTHMENGACQACHTVKFASLADGHPPFGKTLFKRRPRIVFDHVAHFTRHFAARTSAGKAPTNCSSCHVPDASQRFMTTRSFESACSACHRQDIAGAALAGRKGVPFFAVPGIDVRELKARGVDIGDWPDWSEEPVTPFMRLMLTVDGSAAAALDRLKGVDLLDLRAASPDQVRAAAELAAAVKRLLGDLIVDGGPASGHRLVPALEALDNAGATVEGTGTLLGHLPVEVLQAAARDWFPRLANELKTTLPHLPQTIPGPQAAADTAPTGTAGAAAPAVDQSDILGDTSGTAAPKVDQPDILGDAAGAAAPKVDQSDILGDTSGTAVPKVDQSDILGDTAGEAAPKVDQSDILDDAAGTAAPKAAPVVAVTTESAPPPPPLPVEPKVGPEEWMTMGGWYRQDAALLYRPTGHADPFLKAWLDVAAATDKVADGTAPAGLMGAIGGSDRPGACLKCHSVDRLPASGSRAVNWTASRHDPLQRDFVRFSHGPHLHLVGDAGCQTCHAVVPPAAGLSSTAFDDQFRRGDPLTGVVANFAPPTVAVCARCHVAGRAGDACTQCHAYHVGRFEAPTLPTSMDLTVPADQQATVTR